MYEMAVQPPLERLLKKLSTKNPPRHAFIMKKMHEVVHGDPHHYKNLRYDLSEFKRVHIDASFVLIFKVVEPEKLVVFEWLDHHDRVYRR